LGISVLEASIPHTIPVRRHDLRVNLPYKPSK
jgi:hypothetical protein